MIIRHSLKILEQLSEIEEMISKVERYMEQRGIEVDREQLLMKIARKRETELAASRKIEKKN